MIYSFKFNVYNKLNYIFSFNALLNNIYTLYFFGFGIYEIIKYTIKYTDLTSTEKEFFLNDLYLMSLTDDELGKNIKLFSENKTIDIRKIAQCLSNSIIASNKHKLDAGILTKTDVTNKVYHYVENLMQTRIIKDLWGMISSQSCNYYINKHYFKDLAKEFSIYKYEADEKYNTENITRTEPYFIENENRREIIYDKNKDIENNINIDKIFLVCTDFLDIKEFYTNYYKKVENVRYEMQKLKSLKLEQANLNAHRNSLRHGSYNNKTDAAIKSVKLSHKYIQKTANKFPRRYVARVKNVSFKIRKRVDTLRREDYKRTFLNVTNNIGEIKSAISKELENYPVLGNDIRFLKLVDAIINSIDFSKKGFIEKQVVNEFNRQEVENTEVKLSSINKNNYLNLEDIVAAINRQKFREIASVPESGNKNVLEQAQPVIPVNINNVVLTDALNNVAVNKERLVNTFVMVNAKPPQNVSANVKAYRLKPKHLSFYKRWRFKTGKAHDNIWLNPVMTEEYKIALQKINILNDFYNDVSNIVNLYAITKNNLKNSLLEYLQDLFDNKYISNESVDEFVIVSDIFKANVNSLEEYSINNIREAIELLLMNTINEYKSKYIDELIKTKYELAVECKISFKALLDFILFVEQIINVNKSHFAANRAVTVIERVVKILDEWINEAPPTEVPNDYLYLLRWFKWFAEGEKNKHLDDIELNGLTVIESIKNQMVHYFESRWGKRIVEYGPDGMYIYSKDYSYINRIRGKKHGTSKMLVDRNTMKEDYGISEKDLPFSVEGNE